DRGIVRVPLALAAMWFAWWINVIGVRSYQRTLVVMATITIMGPIIMTVAGAIFTHADFDAAVRAHRLTPPGESTPLPAFSPTVFWGTCVILFSSFIGFDSVSQAGGEAKRPGDLARAILLAIGIISVYYILFTWAVYH